MHEAEAYAHMYDMLYPKGQVQQEEMPSGVMTPATSYSRFMSDSCQHHA